MGFRERLTAMQGTAKEQMSDYHPGGSFAPVPDDDYTFRVKATMEETKKKPSRLRIVWCFVVEDGDLIGRQIWDGTVIEDNKIGLQICRDRVEALGYEWPEDDLGALEDIINDITDKAPRIVARVRTRPNKEGTGENTYVNIRDVLDPFNGEESSPAESEEEVVEEEAPVEEEVVEETKPATKGKAIGKRKEPVPEPEISPELAGLLDFCASQGIDGVTSEMTVEDIIDGLKAGECQFKEEEITAEELAILEACGGEELIERKKAPAPAKKKGLISKKK